MRKYLPLLVTAAALTFSSPAFATGNHGHPDKVTICHAAGREGTTHYNTLTIGYNAVYGPAGHFYENGTPRAGHEQDYLGPCNPYETTTTTTEAPPSTSTTTTTQPVDTTSTTTSTTPTTTTTSTLPTTTSTSTSLAPTTTVAETTTTSSLAPTTSVAVTTPPVPSSSTSTTTVPVVTTTQPTTTTTVVQSPPSGDLPKTGNNTGILLTLASVLTILGYSAVRLTRRPI